MPAWDGGVHQAVVLDEMEARLWESCALVVTTTGAGLRNLERERFFRNFVFFRTKKNISNYGTWLEDIGSQLLVRDSWFLKFPSKLLSMSSTENLHTALPRIALRGVVNTP